MSKSVKAVSDSGRYSVASTYRDQQVAKKVAAVYRILSADKKTSTERKPEAPKKR